MNDISYNISLSELLNDDLGDIGVCIFDNNGKFLYTNKSFLKIRNTTEETYLSRTVYDLYDNNLIDKCILDSVFKKKIPITDVQNVLENGKILRKQLVTIYPILDENGNIKNAIAYYKDLDSFTRTNKAHINEVSDSSKKSEFSENSIIAESPSSKALYEKAKAVAATDATVLITGETGTGKEVLSQYIHNMSSRKNRDMIVVDCTALPASLMESELFGYEKGSFTGASSSKAGLIESADGSTLFLDEINSLPIDLQGKLLRVLETKSIKRLGSIKSKPIDFRLIVATNEDLLECVKNKTFRLDLYYRINVLTFNIPALRNRKEDIAPMAKYFEGIFNRKYNHIQNFSQKVYAEMLNYSWPGNVRELKNFIERLVIMGPEEVKLSSTAIDSILNAEHHESEDIIGDEKTRILNALSLNNNHRENTAKYLGISRRTLQYKLKKYNLLNDNNN